MRNLIIMFLFFIVITGFRVHHNNSSTLNDGKKPFCGIMTFFAENSMSVEDPECVITYVRVLYDPGAEYYPNFNPGESGQIGEINAPGSAGQYITLKIQLTAYCNQVKLYRGGSLYQTNWNPPSQGGFVYFYNVPAGCTTFEIVVE